MVCAARHGRRPLLHDRLLCALRSTVRSLGARALLAQHLFFERWLALSQTALRYEQRTAGMEQSPVHNRCVTLGSDGANRKHVVTPREPRSGLRFPPLCWRRMVSIADVASVVLAERFMSLDLVHRCSRAFGNIVGLVSIEASPELAEPARFQKPQ